MWKRSEIHCDKAAQFITRQMDKITFMAPCTLLWHAKVLPAHGWQQQKEFSQGGMQNKFVLSQCKHIWQTQAYVVFWFLHVDFSLTLNSYWFLFLCSHKLCIVHKAFQSKRNFMRLRVTLRGRHNDLFMFAGYLLSNWAQLVGGWNNSGGERIL